MVQLRVGHSGLRDLPLVDDADGTFYFKGEGDNTIWLSPHDEIATEPCDAAPEEIDVAMAIDRFESVVDWPVERVERSWAGLRSFAPDRLPVYGFAADAAGFFWCVGQGGFGIQTSPAAAKLSAALLLGEEPNSMIRQIDPAVFLPNRFKNLGKLGRRGSRLPSPTFQQGNEKVGDGRLFSPRPNPSKVNFISQAVMTALVVGRGAGKRVDAIVLRMAAVALHPVPINSMRLAGRYKLLPELSVLDWLLV